MSLIKNTYHVRVDGFDKFISQVFINYVADDTGTVQDVKNHAEDFLNQYPYLKDYCTVQTLTKSYNSQFRNISIIKN